MFTKFGYENDNYLFNVEKIIKNEALFVQSWNKYFLQNTNSLPGL